MALKPPTGHEAYDRLQNTYDGYKYYGQALEKEKAERDAVAQRVSTNSKKLEVLQENRNNIVDQKSQVNAKLVQEKEAKEKLLAMREALLKRKTTEQAANTGVKANA